MVEVDDKRSASESLMHRVNHCASSEGVNVTDSEGASSEGVTVTDSEGASSEGVTDR